MLLTWVHVVVISVLWCPGVHLIDVDPEGYVGFCPCMGRFGNQADHYLGAISFAKNLDRTLILPPWVEYRRGQRNSVQVPFDTYFKLEPLAGYMKTITMERFMKEVAPIIWPPEKRTVFCYTARRGGDQEGCNAKEGNPFGPFWDTFNIDFVKSEFYGPLSYSTEIASVKKQWNQKYPASKYPVLAFVGAPAGFPVKSEHVAIQSYFQWSDAVMQKVNAFLKEHLVQRPFLGIHMRNGRDWENACQHAKDPKRHLFGSANCLGDHFEHGVVTPELCFPPQLTVIQQVKSAVKAHKIKTVFIASDNDFMIDTFQKEIKKIHFVRLPYSDPHVDLAILGQADHYIGNCISTFSAFATRERKLANKSVDYWAYPTKRKDEL